MYINNNTEIQRGSIILARTLTKEFVGQVEFIDSKNLLYGTWGQEPIDTRIANVTVLRHYNGRLTEQGQVYNKTNPQNRI